MEFVVGRMYLDRVGRMYTYIGPHAIKGYLVFWDHSYERFDTRNLSGWASEVGRDICRDAAQNE